jgi:hypothetical protein
VVGEEGVRHGSLIDFVNAVSNTASPKAADSPGIIIANPCQLLWYRGGLRAVSQLEWLEGLPKQSAVHEPMRIDPVKNTIPGNKDYREHVKYMFDQVLTDILKKEAKIDIIAAEHTSMAVLEHLAEHCK